MKCSSLLIRVEAGWGGASCSDEGSQPWLQAIGLVPVGRNLSSFSSFQCDCIEWRKMSKLGSREMLSFTPYNKTKRQKDFKRHFAFYHRTGHNFQRFGHTHGNSLKLRWFLKNVQNGYDLMHVQIQKCSCFQGESRQHHLSDKMLLH